MLVLSLDSRDRASLVDALNCYQESYRNMLKNAEVGEEFDAIDKMVDYSVSLRDKAKEMDLQELAERCMSFFWEHLQEEDLEDWGPGYALADDMGLDKSELIELFHKAGFTEE